MIVENLSIVLFTVLVQAAAGLLIMYTLIPGKGITEDKIRAGDILVPVVALLLAMSGLVISFLHLGYPANSLNALNHLKSSWMSREILSVSLLIAFLVIWIITILKWGKGRISSIISIISSIISFLLLYTMIRLYTLPAMIYLDTPLTPISFFAGAFYCGGLILLIISRDALMSIDIRIIIISMFFFLLSLISTSVFGLSVPHRGNIYTVCLLTYFLAIFVNLTVFIPTDKNKRMELLVISLLVGSAAIILSRIFFLNYTIIHLW
jgi:DMSO reductase anchor subunit